MPAPHAYLRPDGLAAFVMWGNEQERLARLEREQQQAFRDLMLHKYGIAKVEADDE